MNYFTPANLDLWIKLGKNVLFEGKHGTGKTMSVLSAFNRNNLRYLYFSASTMDPWVDFVGIPKIKIEDEKEFIEFVLPKALIEGNPHAIFLDEYNRAPSRVRNAVMEIIQFKAVNGHKLGNLQIVWAAINPRTEDEMYDVADLDPAQKDRFQIHCAVPYEPNVTYFKNKFGIETATAAIEWWNTLPEEIKADISPRRLDEALIYHNQNGDISHILPIKANISALRTRLEFGSIGSKLNNLLSADPKVIEQFFTNENNYSSAIKPVIETKKFRDRFLAHLPKDKITNLVTTNPVIEKTFYKLIPQSPVLEELSRTLLTTAPYPVRTKIQQVHEVMKLKTGKFTIDGKEYTSETTTPFAFKTYQLGSTIISKANKLAFYNYTRNYILDLLALRDKDLLKFIIKCYDYIMSNSNWSMTNSMPDATKIFTQYANLLVELEGCAKTLTALQNAVGISVLNYHFRTQLLKEDGWTN